MVGKYRVKPTRRILAIVGLAGSVVFAFVPMTTVEDTLAKDFGIPVVLVQLFIWTISLLGIWHYLWVLTERVEVHEDHIVHRAWGMTTTIRYENITFFSPKVLSGLRKRISKAVHIADAYGDAVTVPANIEHLNEIVDYVGSKCGSPERRARALPIQLKIILCFGFVLDVIFILGLLFRFGVL